LGLETGLRILFSAHGLPESIVKAGDPYQWQVEQTVAAILQTWSDPTLDIAICYQSRATPQKWIGPSTEIEIERAAADKMAVLAVPIAFVSEHSETLVELDIEYRDLAHRVGVPAYFRVPTQNAAPGFINALAGLVRNALARGPGLVSHAGERFCSRDHHDCPFSLSCASRVE
jgi:ferrochelatase